MGKGKKREKQEDHILSRTELKARAPSKVGGRWMWRKHLLRGER